jgi:hypothetical protein
MTDLTRVTIGRLDACHSKQDGDRVSVADSETPEHRPITNFLKVHPPRCYDAFGGVFASFGKLNLEPEAIFKRILCF